MALELEHGQKQQRMVKMRWQSTMVPGKMGNSMVMVTIHSEVLQETENGKTVNARNGLV